MRGGAALAALLLCLHHVVIRIAGADDIPGAIAHGDLCPLPCIAGRGGLCCGCIHEGEIGGFRECCQRLFRGNRIFFLLRGFALFETRENALLSDGPLPALARGALYVPVAAGRNIEKRGALGLGQAKALSLCAELIGECDGLRWWFCNHAGDATRRRFSVQAISANCKKRFPRTLARALLGDFRQLSAIGKKRIPRITGTGFACELLKLFAISAK